MIFTDLIIKPEYRSLTDNIVKDFYMPLLSNSVCYKRAVGFFSSTALIEISKGISGLIKNGGKIQLVASPQLSDEDIEAINKGFELRSAVIERALIKSFSEPKNLFEEERLNLLANLIADGSLDIKIAITEKDNMYGIYHEKMGLIYDTENNIVAFTGSMNETNTAFSYNYESIDVFCSWNSEKERVFRKESAFAAIWNDCEPSIKTIDFPDVAKDLFRKYKRNDPNYYIDQEQFKEKGEQTDEYKQDNKISVGPRIPDNLHLHDYQNEAIDEWEKRNFVGIFDMATGTGKTYTGLGAISRLYERLNENLAVVIVCPYQHLVEQWIEDIVKFNMKPIVGYSSSSQRDWKKRLKEAVISFNLGVSKHFCFITTNATFSSEQVQDQINKIKGNIILMIDEAHNFGAENLSRTLNYSIPYRLALSATLERHGDEAGTEKLFNYFGDKCIEYTLKQAIDSDKLTPYYYFPVVTYLNEEELTDYKKITKEIYKHCSTDKKGKMTISETGKMLLIKRARIIAAAQGKILKLADVMEKYKNDKHMLVYCGAATLKDPGYVEGRADEEEKRQIDIVTDMLGNRFDMRISKFTSEESAEEREQLKVTFAEGKHLQTLVAIRCLDEGVNIPSIKTAFILASSTNPKEYVQRRGRVLRKANGKTHATIYDFVTLPLPLEDMSQLSDEEIRMLSSLANKEVIRMKDFASIAENPSVADMLINNISEAYKLNEIGGEEDDIWT